MSGSSWPWHNPWAHRSVGIGNGTEFKEVLLIENDEVPSLDLDCQHGNPAVQQCFPPYLVPDRLLERVRRCLCGLGFDQQVSSSHVTLARPEGTRCRNGP